MAELDELRRERLRQIIRDFFQDKPPGTTIEQHELDGYHRRLREAARSFDKPEGTPMKTKEEKLAENIADVLENGPGLRYGRNTWIVAKDPKRGFHLEGGLGGMGVGQMWVRTMNTDRLTAEYIGARTEDSTGCRGAEEELPDAACKECGVTMEPGPSLLDRQRYDRRVCAACEMKGTS